MLVTGGAGFIGSHLGQRLLARGDEVTVLDNFNDFYDPALKRANAALLAGARIVEGDIRDGGAVGRLFRDGRFDVLAHLAAMAGVRPSLADPLHYADVNLKGTLVLLEELRKHPQVRMVFASSSSVYGAKERIPFREDEDVQRPVSPYAATKVAGELLCATYQHLYGIPTTCLRFFTVYGPRQRPEMAIARFVRDVLEDRPIPFFGDGSSRRDYTYIDDIVDGVVAAIERCQGFEVYNLGESATTSLSELVGRIGELCDREPRLERLPAQPGDVPVTCADVSKARERLGYAPKVPLAEGLKRYVEWYRAWREARGGTG
ncbi:MAG TPA: NAD-dependent epimerase/dehydratase family protein [Planctomycetota bacterium]|nr:NAD-dependent epimerase/dehydratase family protein [Planctomycetota bacterium]